MPVGAGARAGSPVRRPEFANEIRCGGYTRHVRRDAAGRPTAQILVIRGHRVHMSVKAAADALGFDFRNQVIRPDLGPDYCRRPGLYLHEVLQNLRESRRVILLNGNNVGYWGNQFVIDNGRLVYKPKGPLFDDGRLHAHATGDHAFFVDSQRSPHRFQIADVKLFGRPRELGDSGVNIEVVSRHVPPCGISGFPLLRQGRAVWHEYGEYAWDPGLLFDLGALKGDKYPEIRAYVRRLLDEGAPLAHHPMTVVGLNREHDIVLLVVERTEYSPGMTVARAAELLATRFGVRDAIVLGAAGDTQLATTEEGFLITPFIADYARSAARPVPPHLLSATLSGTTVWARPVPSYVLLQITD